MRKCRGATQALRGSNQSCWTGVCDQHIWLGCVHECPSLGMEVSRSVFKNIIFPGPFHTKMNFIGMLTKKKARGSGYAKILIEAKLVTSGTLVSFLSGKAYSKVLFNLKAVVEALERLLFEVFAEENDIEIPPEALLNLINACSSSSCREQLDNAPQDESVTHITNKYEEF